MIYVLTIFLLAMAILNLIRGKAVIIKPGINTMDIISIGLAAVIIIAFSIFMKSDLMTTLLLAAVMAVYVYSSRSSRGITEDGVMISGASPLLVRAFPFEALKQVNVKNEDDLTSFAIVIASSNNVDIQRYPKDMREMLVSLFKDKGVDVIFR